MVRHLPDYDSHADEVIVEQFLTYVESIRPGFTETLEGNLFTEIAEYEQVTKCKLPQEYRSFLEVMGESDGGLELFERAKTSASLLADFYRENVLTGNCHFPPDTIPVAVGGWYVEEACISIVGAEVGKVWLNNASAIAFQYADTLSSLACNSAFVAIEMNSVPISGMFTSDDVSPRVVAVRELLTDNQFQIVEFSGSIGVAARRGQVLVFARQHSGRKCWIRIAANTKREIAVTAKAICNPCGVRFDQWWTSQRFN